MARNSISHWSKVAAPAVLGCNTPTEGCAVLKAFTFCHGINGQIGQNISKVFKWHAIYFPLLQPQRFHWLRWLHSSFDGPSTIFRKGFVIKTGSSLSSSRNLKGIGRLSVINNSFLLRPHELPSSVTLHTSDTRKKIKDDPIYLPFYFEYETFTGSVAF